MFKKGLPIIAKELKLAFQDLRPRNLSKKCLDTKPKTALIKPRMVPVVSLSRNYAKGKDIKKVKKKKIQIYENELSEFFDVDKLLKDLNKPVDTLKNELAQHTTLRSSQGAIENLKVQFEGKTYNLQDLAEIGKKNHKMFILDLSSFPQTIPAVMEVLHKSELNVNVQQDGEKIYVPIPKVTREHRETLAKKSKFFYFKCKESIRDVQLKYMKNFKNTENLSEETRFRITNQLVALKDKHVSMAEIIFKEKELELLKSE